MGSVIEKRRAWVKDLKARGIRPPRWICDSCYSCRLFNCCLWLDNLRTPITEDDVIVGYEPGCKHYKPENEEALNVS